MKYNLAFKGHLENLTSSQGHDLIGRGHVVQISRSVCSPEHIYGVLIALVGRYQKLLPKKTAGDFV